MQKLYQWHSISVNIFGEVIDIIGNFNSYAATVIFITNYGFLGH